jgi:uncharacterized membrane protein YhaH (DUF805 family)
MNLGSIYTGFEGRISRRQFWVATILLVIVAVAILMVSLAVAGERDYMAIRLNGFVITLVFLYPALAVWVKRLHDRNRPGTMVIVFLVPWLLHQIMNLIGITGDPTAFNSLDVLFFGINLVIGLWFVIDLGLLRGTPGPNKYGPDPLTTSGVPGGQEVT